MLGGKRAVRYAGAEASGRVERSAGIVYPYAKLASRDQERKQKMGCGGRGQSRTS
jgi:hypothetical protein